MTEATDTHTYTKVSYAEPGVTKRSGCHKEVYAGVLFKKIIHSLTFIQCLLKFF